MNSGNCKCAWRKIGWAGLFLLTALPAARAQNPVPAQAAPQNTTQAPFVQSRIVAAIDESNLVTLRGNTHPLARAQYDQGAVADNQPMNRMMLLLQRSPDQETALRTLLDRQQSQSTPNFHQWLTPQQFGQQFGPADADVQIVTNWLTSHGFQVTRVSAGKTIIEFSGNAGQVRSAFHTEIHRYAVNGQQHLANSTDPQIPAALAPVVAGTVSLHNFGRKALHEVGGLVTVQKQVSSANPAYTLTCSNGGNPFPCYVVAPSDFATIYNTQPLLTASVDGTGQTIAIVGDSNINCDDVTNFRNLFDLPVTTSDNCTQPTSNVQVILNGPDPGLTPDEIEADLDVEWSGAVARGAHIDFVASEGTEASQGVDLSAEYIVDNNLAPVMSESFGDCEAGLGNAGNLYYKSLWEQAAAQGITAIVSTGDSGSAGCDNDNTEMVSTNGLAVNGIGSTPFNIAAGGTDFDDAGTLANMYWSASNNQTTKQSVLSYIPEIPWDDSCAATSLMGCSGLSIAGGSDGINIVAAGGGESNCATVNAQFVCTAGYAKPSWQSGAAVTGIAQTDGVRDVPDIALFAASGSASDSFYPICATDLGALCTDGSFEGVGGTSSAAPAFAGIMAMTNQYMASQSQPARQGNANYVLYSLASNQVNAATSCKSTSSPNTANGGCSFYDIVQGSNSVPCAGGLGCTNQNHSNTPGVLEELNNSGGADGTTLGWQAVAGYDMATGLGSVNAYNLVHNWAGVVGAFKATTSTLQLCNGANCVPGNSMTLTLTHGENVTVTASVSPTPPSTGTPTGDVTLLGTPNTLSNNDGSSSAGADYFAGSSETGVINFDAFTLSNGSVTASTKYILGGNYAVTLHYPGDGTFGASTSTAVNVIVSPENSTTTTAVQPIDPNTLNFVSSTAYGLLDFINVNVVGVSSGDQTASGAVSVTDENAAFGGASCCTLNTEGTAELQAGVNAIPVLTTGMHSFKATYPGDSSYNGSASSAVSFNVTPAATTAAVSTSSNSVAAGTPVTLTATIGTDSVGLAPAGTVTFLANNVAISGFVNYTRTNGSFFGPPQGSGGNPASVTATLSGYIPAAMTTVTAMYNGDTNYISSPISSGVTINVSQNTFSIASPNFSPGPALSIATPGQSGTANITVSSSNGFTGTITVSCSVTPTTLTDTPACRFSQTSSSSAPAVLTNTTTSVPLTLNVTTTASSATQPYAARPTRNAPPSAPLIWFSALACLAILFALRRSQRNDRAAYGNGNRSGYGYASLALLLLIVIATAVSCSSSSGSSTPPAGGGNPGTTAATYTVRVTASTTVLPTQTNTITVNVQ